MQPRAEALGELTVLQMPQSSTKLYAHLVFTTKHREPLIQDAWRDDLHRFISGILKNRRAELLSAGSVEDHIHLLIRYLPTQAIADLVRDIKTNSSMWRHNLGDSTFAWQHGYGAFSVSKSMLPTMKAYLANQREHHRVHGFQSEYRELLTRHEVEFDEQYLWD